ncbi:MAG: hypothetical protein K9M82_03700 [Deltaproteobacteria bacterium]|nr:hypothetical protein [Deltaproteobacteria bacterium]
MAKKKGSKKKKNRSAPLTPEQRELLETLLTDPARIDTGDIHSSLPDPALAAAFLERLPADDSDLVPVLTAVREGFEEKSVQKSVRKAAFRFEQRGVHVPEGPSRESAVLRREALEEREPFAFLSPIDAMGVRGVLFGIPRAPTGFELGAALVSDESGILQYAGGAFSKKKALAARDDFLQDFGHVVPATPEHAVSVLERAHRARPEAPGGAPYLRARPWILDRIVPSEIPPIRGLLPEETPADQPFTDSMAARLLQHEILIHWMADPREVRSLAEKIQEVEESPIYLSEDQRDRRTDEIIQAWIQEGFSEPQRQRIAERLEETAYTLYNLGDEELARLACIAARSLEARETVFHVNPLLRVMTERTLTLIRQGYEDPAAQGEPGEEDGEAVDEEGPPSGLIIP